jgi:hypothetical protein
MARVRFTSDFDYRPTPQTIIGYLSGMEMTVKRDCADRAVAAGKAVDLDPKKDEPNGETTIGG